MHAVIVAKGAAALVAVAAGAAGVDQSGLVSHANTSSNVIRVFIARPGDTLAGIAAMFCGNAADYPSLAAASGISDPNVIMAGQRIILNCGAGGSSGGGADTASHSAHMAHLHHLRAGGSSSSQPSGSNYATGSAVIPGVGSTYSVAGLERLWIGAGGSPARAVTAACIAEHESSGNQDAVSPTADYGLWQIHNGGYAMFNPEANAARAVAMSSDGTNWSQWTTAGSCGV